MFLKPWQSPHYKVIVDFLIELNRVSDKFILKDGTGLMLVYDLDRFSEDIDLDTVSNEIPKLKAFVENFCKKHGYTYRIGKDTNTVFRIFVDYHNSIDGAHPLKVEVSVRQHNLPIELYTRVSGVHVYRLPVLALQKLGAYTSRDKLRDLYDVTFIINNYHTVLSDLERHKFATDLSYKGLEQFDYLVSTQTDELIDTDKLAIDFLKAWDTLGLLRDDSKDELDGIRDSIMRTN